MNNFDPRLLFQNVSGHEKDRLNILMHMFEMQTFHCVQEKLIRRANMCIQMEGLHFEHML